MPETCIPQWYFDILQLLLGIKFPFSIRATKTVTEKPYARKNGLKFNGVLGEINIEHSHCIKKRAQWFF